MKAMTREEFEKLTVMDLYDDLFHKDGRWARIHQALKERERFIEAQAKGNVARYKEGGMYLMHEDGKERETRKGKGNKRVESR